jgi:hypothetical protein
MRNDRNRIWSFGLLAGWLAACGSDTTSSEPSAQGGDTAGAPAVTAVTAAAPSPKGAGSTPGSVTTSTPSVGSAPTTTPAAVGAAAAPAPGAGAPAAPAAQVPAAGAAMAGADTAPIQVGPADTCKERTVSYSKPCHNDPDPCGIHSGWPGDEYCLLPPKEGEGIQIHIGPSDYAQLAEVAKYTIKPGQEFNNSVIAPINLTDQKWFQRIRVQMRPGSHHWISTVVDGKPEPKFYDDTACGGATGKGSLGGGQNLIYDNPPGGVPAPENAGLGRSVEGNSSLCMNLHAYNFTDREQLREIWINIYFIDEDKVTQRAQGIGMIGGLGLNVGPHQKKDLTYSGRFQMDGRIIQLFGHRHAWTPRFAVWLKDKLVYDSWSWEDSVTFNYDSITMNPPINTAGKTDGAVSGVVDFKAGDELKFTCFIENNSDNTLGFSNQVYEGEMCNLWGSSVGAGLSGTFF